MENSNDELVLAPAINLNGKRILVVDDNKINMEVMAGLLKELGYEVDTASSGDECLKKFSESEDGTYGLIFMDLHMPGTDGLAASKLIRNMPRRDAKFVNISALTVDDSEDILEQCAVAGMDSYILKPATKESVSLLINGGNPLEKKNKE
ncbi:MAG: response regulator [Treponema sp.]|nr:response regulator [Treponema sp.]MBP5438377.1 response regulator [Treponema sp.]MBP5747881.1 response regulator [Treponema sp.]